MLESNIIKAIYTSSIRRITSSQGVIDLQPAVKELVENSLDTEATSMRHFWSCFTRLSFGRLECLSRPLRVQFKQYKLGGIEVIDNGSGISEECKDIISVS